MRVTVYFVNLDISDVDQESVLIKTGNVMDVLIVKISQMKQIVQYVLLNDHLNVDMVLGAQIHVMRPRTIVRQ